MPFWLNSILYSFSLCMQTIEVIPFIFRIAQNKDKKIRIFQFIFNVPVLWFCTILMKVFDLYWNTCICMSSFPNKRTVLWLFPQQLFVCIHFYRNVQVYKFERYYDKLQKKTNSISCMDMFIWSCQKDIQSFVYK